MLRPIEAGEVIEVAVAVFKVAHPTPDKVVDLGGLIGEARILTGRTRIFNDPDAVYVCIYFPSGSDLMKWENTKCGHLMEILSGMGSTRLAIGYLGGSPFPQRERSLIEEVEARLHVMAKP